MRQLSIREVRSLLGRLDEILSEAGEIELTRHGRPIARIVPARRVRDVPSHAELRARMPKMKIASSKYIREDRDSR